MSIVARLREDVAWVEPGEVDWGVWGLTQVRNNAERAYAARLLEACQEALRAAGQALTAGPAPPNLEAMEKITSALARFDRELIEWREEPALKAAPFRMPPLIQAAGNNEGVGP